MVAYRHDAKRILQECAVSGSIVQQQIKPFNLQPMEPVEANSKCINAPSPNTPTHTCTLTHMHTHTRTPEPSNHTVERFSAAFIASCQQNLIIPMQLGMRRGLVLLFVLGLQSFLGVRLWAKWRSPCSVWAAVTFQELHEIINHLSIKQSMNTQVGG